MARKPETSRVARTPAPRVGAPRASAAPVSNSIKSQPQITNEMIARRAYEIWQREGGSEMDNWLRAERELRGA